MASDKYMSSVNLNSLSHTCHLVVLVLQLILLPVP